MNSIFADNLRRLRQSKGCTQEQVADHLGVSPQSVSRWECGATFPDILLLPAIAEHYCVTVDDLFRENTVAYKHYADRLLSLFESTLDRDDFIRADNEYRRLLDSGSYTTDDLRSYGVLHEIAMIQCLDKALLAYNEVIARGPEEDRGNYYRTKMQRIHLLSHAGRDDINLKRQRKELDEHPNDPWSHVLMLAALDNARDYEESYRQFRASVQSHPDNAELYVFGGWACMNLDRTEEALRWLDRALELDPAMDDAKYAKTQCYEKLGDYARAADEWTRLASELENRGFTIEAEEPRKKAEECRAKICAVE